MTGGSPPIRRLIPAHAGKTEKAGIPASLGSAHPRSRGENCTPGVGIPEGRGSSPLTRGKRYPHCRRRVLTRLIPAHAGKTLRSRRLEKLAAAHPRSRGENPASGVDQESFSGSSPLTRGKPDRTRQPLSTPRLIPAHAGKTCSLARVPQRGEAHPRSRGENWDGGGCGVVGWGSSPLTRGKRDGRGWS